MSGIGFSELIILFLIGLIVLGPERLPRVANQLGNWLGQARRMTRVMKRQLEEELNLENELSIKPDQSVGNPSYVTPANSPAKFDDTYSPAHSDDEPGTGISDTSSPGHGSDEPGTGVGDSVSQADADHERDSDPESPLNSDPEAKAADQKALEEDIDSALSPGETDTDRKSK